MQLRDGYLVEGTHIDDSADTLDSNDSSSNNKDIKDADGANNDANGASKWLIVLLVASSYHQCRSYTPTDNCKDNHISKSISTSHV